MAEILYDKVPSLDLADFTSGTPDQKRDFVKTLGKAYTNIGFVSIKNHGLSDDLTKNLYQAVEKFFRLPDEVKKKYEKEELAGQRGYISKGREKAKGRNTGDLKEFFHVGQPPQNQRPDYPDNIWPSEVPELEKYTSEAYLTLLQAGVQMLRAIALFLELPENYFDDKVRAGNRILRPIHYFPIED
ncbi:MAG: 2-oxoglutarate and iron-dependent oxygenase domain-containing protein, partial [Marinoscillum sp.]|uniref:2-oxoglutarate and iron-dependent oxygenase domain-containing protein n=1 Tax=Marinoscillum sp. TaxID=2024838 RepID=UPI0032F88AAE